jgi:hypothetical protein
VSTFVTISTSRTNADYYGQTSHTSLEEAEEAARVVIRARLADSAAVWPGTMFEPTAVWPDVVSAPISYFGYWRTPFPWAGIDDRLPEQRLTASDAHMFDEHGEPLEVFTDQGQWEVAYKAKTPRATTPATPE